MKKKISGFLLMSIFILVGCQSKETLGTNINSSSSTNSVIGIRDTTKYNFQPLMPDTTPQLNQAQKSQVNSKIDSSINNVNSSLKSLEDAKDIDLNQVN